jgi:hypothetical protein
MARAALLSAVQGVIPADDELGSAALTLTWMASVIDW